MFKQAVFICLFFLLIGCGGGDSNSTTEITPTPEPPAPVAPTPSPIVIAPEIIRADASRLLSQATFGANLVDIDLVEKIGVEAWIDQQINLQPTSHLDYIFQIDDETIWHDERFEAWFDTAITSPDQLRQRVAFALSEILVVSDNSAIGDYVEAMANYYDILVDNAFGNYRTLLEKVTLSPVMGSYLSMLGNEKPNVSRNIRPDENYAREAMQLFSIGLVELNIDGSEKLINGAPIPTYDLDIIKGFAHVFTGWNFNGTTEQTWKRPEIVPLLPMTAVEEFHDKSEKILLNNFVVPAEQSAYQDLTMALDNIFAHDNVAPFISRQLIQRLVTSNPSPEYIARIAGIFNDNGDGVKGDLAKVIKAILLDDEARNGFKNFPTIFGKIREPLIKATHLWRAFNASSPNNRFQLAWPLDPLAQAPLSAPSVFNFFSPNYRPPSEVLADNIVAPELQLMTESTITKLTNYMAYSTLWGHVDAGENNQQDDRILIDVSPWLSLTDDPQTLVEQLDLVLTASTMSDEMKTILVDFYQEDIWSEDREKVLDLLFLIVSSPQYAVQK